MKLVFTSGPNAGGRYTIEGTITIGRDPSNDIELADHAVSLVHCQVTSIPERREIKDLGSTNGTWVNGTRVVSRSLGDGDGIVLGGCHIRVEVPSVGVSPAVLPSIPVAGSIDTSVQYFLKRKIAEGGMGAIYEAEQIGAEGFIKRVAIKTILPEFVSKRDFVSSFVGEARLVANLVHQNIVQIHHLGRYNDGYYIAMEYIDGVNLCDLTREHTLLKRDVPPEIAAYIAGRVCRGLAYAHGKCDEIGRPLGLVHRDVSPRNIMVTREGEVKLTDFGVAKAAHFMEPEEGMVVGSVEYMSPEQAQCGVVDARSDLFSLGLVLYELLTGVRVFRCVDGNIEATIDRVIRDDVPDPRTCKPGLGQEWVDVLMTCLARDPAARFASADALGDALDALLSASGSGMTAGRLADYVRGLRA